LDEILRVLLDAGAVEQNLSSKIKDVFPAIAEHGTVDILKTLERLEYNLLEDPENYSKALISALSNNDTEMTHYVATKRSPTVSEVKAAILVAIRSPKQRMPSIEALLRFSMSLFFDIDDGNKPLIVPSLEGYAEVVAMLLQHARYSAPVLEHALKVAICRGHLACARLILDSQHLSPTDSLALCARLDRFCIPFHSKNMLPYLLIQGVSPNTRDPETGRTLLHLAAAESDTASTKSLVSHGADVHVQGSEHGTALHAAAVCG
jgi:ankyrin repeat protein